MVQQFPTVNSTGSHPIQFMTCPLTDEIDLLHGVRDDLVTTIGVKCCGAAKFMLAPLSGKIHTVAC